MLNPVNTDSLGEGIQRVFPGARVIKALNTMNAGLMVDPPARRRRPRGAEMVLPLWLRPYAALGTAEFNFEVVRAVE